MKNNKDMGSVIYTVLSITAYFFITYLFWAQSVRPNGKYDSDLGVHMARAIANGGSGYSLESKLVVLINKITGGGTVGFCLLLGVFVILTPYAVGMLFDFMDNMEEGDVLGKVRSRYIGLISIFIAPLVIPYLWFHFYSNTMNINAWHNSTSMEMRLFSIIGVAFYIHLQQEIAEKESISFLGWLFLSGSLFVSTWFKPSFFVGFAPVMLIWVIFDLFREKWSITAIKNQFLLGCAAIPSGVMVILQYYKLYGSREDVYLSINNESNNIIYAIRVCLFLIIPLIILFFNRKKILSDYKKGNRIYVQIWALWAIELLYHQLFMEVGRNGGNFGWGVRIGNYFVVIMSLRLFGQNVHSARVRVERGELLSLLEKAYLGFIGFLILWEIGCGIYYFGWVLTGHSFSI